MAESKTKSNEINLQPINGKVLVKVEKVKKNFGVVELPSDIQQNNKTHTAVVVAVFDKYTNDKGFKISPIVKVGDRVLISKWSGSEVIVNIDDKDVSFISLPQSDIHAIFV